MSDTESDCGTTPVVLGFVEDNTEIPEDLVLHSALGGSGKSALLNPTKVPTNEDLACGVCGNPMKFLVHTYSPIEENDNPEVCERAFHRTLHVWMCPKSSCHTADSSNCSPRCFKAFRSQVGEENPFVAEDEEENTLVWKDDAPSHGELVAEAYPLKEIVTEDEPTELSSAEVERADDKDPDVETKVVTVNAKTGESKMADDEEMAAFQAAAEISAAAKDQCHLAFQDRIQRESAQVLRIDHGGEPLWVGTPGQLLSSEVPPCSCGAPRIFELQIMPQLLFYLGLDEALPEDKGAEFHTGVDWGTLCVYSCSQACDPEEGAVSVDFLYRQCFDNTAPVEGSNPLDL